MPKFPNFISPHIHPNSLDSASTPEAFAKLEKEFGTGALTCTDHGSLGAIYKIYKLAKENDLTPCPGLEMYFRASHCDILERNGVTKTPTVPKGSAKEDWLQKYPQGTYVDYNKYHHGTIGFRDYQAYLTGVKLLSRADDRAEQHGEERKPLFDWSDVEELAAQNVTFGAGCLVGMVSRHLISDKVSTSAKLGIAKGYFDKLYGLFGDKMFVELFPHKCTHNWVEGVFIEVADKVGVVTTLKYYLNKTLRTNGWEGKANEMAQLYKKEKDKFQILTGVKNYYTWEDCQYEILNIELKQEFVQNECSPAAPEGDIQWGVNKWMLGMAQKYGMKVLVSDDAHFTTPEYKIVQDIRLSQGNSWKFFESYHRYTSDSAWEYFHNHMGIDEKTFEGWIQNSYDWRDSFKGFKFDNTIELPTKFFPKDTLKHTKELIKKHGRMPNDPVYIERLKKEIKILHENGVVDLLPYFFISEEVFRVYKNNELLTGPGRGSACGLLLAYLLGFSQVDPIKYGLSLDRFITLDRIKSRGMPDIDNDLLGRDILTGMECPVVELEAEDGSKHVLPEDFKIETTEGVKPVKEVVEKGLEFTPWWNNEVH